MLQAVADVLPLTYLIDLIEAAYLRGESLVDDLGAVAVVRRLGRRRGSPSRCAASAGSRASSDVAAGRRPAGRARATRSATRGASSDGDSERDLHAGDFTFHRPHRPDVVVYPTSTDDVVAVLALADEHRIPVTPFGAGSSLEGHVIPRRRRHHPRPHPDGPRSSTIDPGRPDRDGAGRA